MQSVSSTQTPSHTPESNLLTNPKRDSIRRCISSTDTSPSSKLTDFIRLLIEHGANIEKTDELGRHPLHHAANAGNFYGIAQFLDLGADVNATDLEGSTPLEYIERQA